MKTGQENWTVMPASPAELQRLREHCRRLVRRRALISAGVSALPVPGLDVMSDVSLFALLIEDINRAFGLTHAQIGLLPARAKLVAYEAAVGVGGMMVGKLVTRELVLQLFKRVGMESLARTAAKVVPIAGQLASAAIGYSVFKTMGYQHVDACVKVSEELLAVQAEAAKPARAKRTRARPAAKSQPV